VHSAEEGGEAAREEEIHEEKPALVPDEREFKFGAGDGGAPRIFLHVIHGEGANFPSAMQADRRAEQDAERARANQKKSGKITDWRTAEPHASER
jgi:hypothetical protein